MTVSKTFIPQGAKISAFIKRLRRREAWRSSQKDLSCLDEQTRLYLQQDQASLREEWLKASHAQDTRRQTSLQVRLTRYYVIENFFLYLADQGCSTALAAVTPALVTAFLQAKAVPPGNKQAIQVLIQHNQVYRLARYQQELSAFFSRASQAKLIPENPLASLRKKLFKLEPRTPSAQTQADCQAFKAYLQQRVASNLLSPGTASRLYDHLLILLHDAEVQHITNPDWPVELEPLFSAPHWLLAWLQGLKNRAPGRLGKVLSQSSLNAYLLSLRQIWLFLKSQGRAAPNYYADLKTLLEQASLRVSGRRATVIEALSEVEVETVLYCITYLSSDVRLRWRDTAMLITALETTIRVDGLNSLRIENFSEIAPGLWTCRVRVKRSGIKDAASPDRLAGDQAEWRDWYMSPQAIAAIDRYLQATGRTWQSQGPVWLTLSGRPLSYTAQKNVIRRWLQVAGCKFIRPHVLRHTGIERLVNKYQLPLPIVQAISQHSGAEILLKVYARPSPIEAFRQVSRLFPAGAQDQVGLEKLILTTGTKLNTFSAEISQAAQERRAFSEADVAELLGKLSRRLEGLAAAAGYQVPAARVLLSLEDYIQLDLVLQSLELSIPQILGFEPRPQRPLILNPTSRQPRVLLKT